MGVIPGADVGNVTRVGVVATFLLSTVVACSSEPNGEVARPERATAAPTADGTPEEPEAGSQAEAIFAVDLPRYTFTAIHAAIERDLVAKFESLFGGVEDVDVAVRRVESRTGDFVAVRIAAVSYRLPSGVPFGALATEVGREFLGATPDNTSDFAGGRGVYMRGRTNGDRTESVAFFIGEEIFVYAFGGNLAAPTEEVSKALLEANDSES